MADKFKMAVMGTGSIASQMAEALSGLDEVEAYAVASRSADKAQEFAQKWGFTKCYGSYEAMARDADIDLIYVATPHAMHYENARLCIEHGRNVLVEKAFTVNAGQAEELIALVHESSPCYEIARTSLFILVCSPAVSLSIRLSLISI